MRALVLGARGVPWRLALTVASDAAFRSDDGVGTPELFFRGSIGPARTSCQRFTAPSRVANA